MFHLSLVAVLLGLELGRDPLAGVHPKPVTGNRRGVKHNSYILAPGYDCPALALVGDSHDLIGQGFGLFLACAGVLLRELCVQAKPSEHSGQRRLVILPANRPQAFPLGYTLTDGVSHLLAVVSRPCHHTLAEVAPAAGVVSPSYQGAD